MSHAARVLAFHDTPICYLAWRFIGLVTRLFLDAAHASWACALPCRAADVLNRAIPRCAMPNTHSTPGDLPCADADADDGETPLSRQQYRQASHVSSRLLSLQRCRPARWLRRRPRRRRHNEATRHGMLIRISADIAICRATLAPCLLLLLLRLYHV